MPDPVDRRGGFRGLNAVAACAALCTCGLVAQDSWLHETGDGSRFLLVPINTKVVHWINLQPAGPADEPPGMQGLAEAVARASLLGSPSGGPIQDSSLAWEKALRQAPANGSRIVQLPGYIGISVTFPGNSLPAIASLLRTRTRRQSLHRVVQHFETVKRRRAVDVAHTPHLGMIRRLLQASGPGRQFLPGFLANTDDILTQDVARAFYRRTYLASRALNVLVGGFDRHTAMKVLSRVFKGRTGGSSAIGFSTAGKLDAGKAPADNPSLMLVGCPVPRDRITGVDLLTEYLAGSPDAFIPSRLRAAGHPKIMARALAPFPAPGGILMLVITEPGARIGPKSPLVEHLRLVLQKATTETPNKDRLAQAGAALRARRLAQLTDPQGLARLLAWRWARTGVVPSGDLAADPHVPAADLLALARRVLAPETLTVVLPGSDR